jgi:hypothetical protein
MKTASAKLTRAVVALLWWRLIDCSFGVIGFVPAWFCRMWARELDSTALRHERAT